MRYCLMICCLLWGFSAPADPIPKYIAKVVIEFGIADVGDEMSALNQNTIKNGCAKPVSKDYYDCVAIGADSVSYLVEGKKIIRKEVPNVTKYKGALPYGIRKEDGLYQVLEKVRAQNGPSMMIGLSDKNMVLETDFIFENNLGIKSNLYLLFDQRGKLISVGSRLNWN